MAQNTLIQSINRFFRRRGSDAHEANDIISLGSAGWRYTLCEKYADIYRWRILNKIFAGMRSVRFVAPPNAYTDKLCAFLENNTVALLWQWWSYGFIVVDITRGDFEVVDASKVRKDSKGHVEEPIDRQWVVLYSDEYVTARLSAFKIIENEFREINELRSSEHYLTHTFGTLGVISGGEQPMTKDDKEQFLNKMKEEIGINRDRYQFIISKGEVHYTPINLPIKDLEIDTKINRSDKLVCDYFQIPYDLIANSGASTYANYEQAVKIFYSTCIGGLAEVLLQLGRYIIRRAPASAVFMPSDSLTFEIDNTEVTLAERNATMDYITKATAEVAALTAAGIDPKPLTDKINEIISQ